MNLDDIRKEIDAIDDQIAALLNKRMEIVAKVAEYKKQTGTGIADNKRENEILARVCTGENGAELKLVFEKIMEISKLKQKKLIDN